MRGDVPDRVGFVGTDGRIEPLTTEMFGTRLATTVDATTAAEFGRIWGDLAAVGGGYVDVLALRPLARLVRRRPTPSMRRRIADLVATAPATAGLVLTAAAAWRARGGGLRLTGSRLWAWSADAILFWPWHPDVRPVRIDTPVTGGRQHWTRPRTARALWFVHPLGHGDGMVIENDGGGRRLVLVDLRRGGRPNCSILRHGRRVTALALVDDLPDPSALPLLEPGVGGWIVTTSSPTVDPSAIWDDTVPWRLRAPLGIGAGPFGRAMVACTTRALEETAAVPSGAAADHGSVRKGATDQYMYFAQMMSPILIE